MRPYIFYIIPTLEFFDPILLFLTWIPEAYTDLAGWLQLGTLETSLG